MNDPAASSGVLKIVMKRRQIMRNEAYLWCAAVIHPVKSASPSRIARI
jgi:hypothetical protein